MGRFEVYRLTETEPTSYVVDVQANILGELSTRVVPLLRVQTAPRQARGLNPTFVIEGQPHSMMTQFISAIPARHLRQPIASLDAQGDDVMRALDTLLVGF